MKPFSVYLVNIGSSLQQIKQKSFEHLCLKDKKLPLFPSIMLRSRDLSLKNKKGKMQVLLTTFEVKREILQQMKVESIIVID